MSFLNLGFAEFMALLGATSALVVALYLLNRARKRQTVATLRFWVQAVTPDASRRRRRIQQPWSLALQLIGLALLLLAIAQPRLGSAGGWSRDHILVLDTSSWMAAGSRTRSLMDQARESARAYLGRVPATDRVMLVRADGLAIPATPLTTNRETVRRAIDESRPAAAALSLDQALAFAAETRRLNARRSGEVVFIGAGRIREQDGTPQAVNGLRVVKVRQAGDNRGLRSIGLRRSAVTPGVWEIFVSVRNYSERPLIVPLVVEFGGARVGSRRLELPAGREQEVTFELRTRAAGWLEARLLGSDALADDDRAVVEIPQQHTIKVTVFSDAPDSLRPLFEANPWVEPSFQARAAYSPKTAGDVIIADGFVPAVAPAAPFVLVAPPEGGAIRVRSRVTNAPVVRWRTDHEVAAGLRARTIELDAADVYTPGPNDIALAEVEEGPVILARTGAQRSVLLGYHPGKSEARFDVATPLLFANILRWLKPEAFEAAEVRAQTVGAVNVLLDADEDTSRLRVLDERGRPLPHTVRGRTLRFFSGAPGTVRFTGTRGERVYSLTLPEVGDVEWTPPQSAAQGLPPRWSEPLARDLWPWFAVLAAICLLIEWMLYGRMRAAVKAVVAMPARLFARRAAS
jgi:hypothetical protein